MLNLLSQANPHKPHISVSPQFKNQVLGLNLSTQTLDDGAREPIQEKYRI
jgi:hypothetical protein